MTKKSKEELLKKLDNLRKEFQVSDREKRLEIRKTFFETHKYSQFSENIWEKISLNKEIVFQEEKVKEVYEFIDEYPNYEVSNLGNFRRRYKNGAIHQLTVYGRKSKRKRAPKKWARKVIRIVPTVKMGGKNLEAYKIVAKTFVPKRTKEHIVVKFIDGDNSNLKADNLDWITKEQSGKETGHLVKTSRKVVLLNEDDEIIEEFRSTREAGKQLNCSYQTILDICNNKVKNKIVNVKFKEVIK